MNVVWIVLGIVAGIGLLVLWWKCMTSMVDDMARNWAKILNDREDRIVERVHKER